MASKTRHGDNRIVGSDRQMSEAMLPTTLDVIRHYNFEWQEQKTKDNGKNPGFSFVADKTLDKVQSLWQKSSIPVVSHRTMKDMLKKSIDIMQGLNKSFERNQYKHNFKKRLSEFLEKSSKLLDAVSYTHLRSKTEVRKQ